MPIGLAIVFAEIINHVDNRSSPLVPYGRLIANMDKLTNPSEPGSPDASEANPNLAPPLLTVSQAYEYLIAEGLPRSKKTIRKWCRLNHVDKKQNVIPGGPKWLITRSSLDARIAEERLIDASLSKASERETRSNRSEPDPVRTGTNPSAPVRDDELVKVLNQQLIHERESRRATEEKNRELIRMYHEISIASTQVGIEIGKGMQEQGKARQLGAEDKPGSNPSRDTASVVRTYPPETPEEAATPTADATTAIDSDGDKPGPEADDLQVQ
jgi:hypothetical protein